MNNIMQWSKNVLHKTEDQFLKFYFNIYAYQGTKAIILWHLSTRGWRSGTV